MNDGWMSFADLEKDLGKVTRTSKGLPEIFKKIDGRGAFDAFRYWATARRAKELNDRGLQTGMEDLIEDGTVQDIINDVRNSDRSADFEEAWRGLKEYQDAALDWLVEAEVLTPKQVQAMRIMNKFYVPFQRVLSEPDHLMDWVAQVQSSRRPGAQGGAEAFVGLPPGAHFFKGDTRPIIDPIESIIGNTRFFTQLGFRKQVENQIAKFADDIWGAQGHAQFIIKIDKKLVASRYTVRQIRQVLRNLGIEMDEVDNEQLDELMTLFAPQSQTKKLPAFSAMITDPKTGKRVRQWYQINDPDTWNALAGLGKQEMTALQKIGRLFAASLRGGVVLSPEFFVRNFGRDSQTAWIQAPTRGTGAKIKGVPFKIPRSIPLVAAVEGLTDSFGSKKLWDEFVASGAAGAALTNITRNSNQEYMKAVLGRKSISRVLASEHGIPWNIQQVWGGMTDMAKGAAYKLGRAGSLMENANRLSTFKALREDGATLLRAGFGARNVTTDFSVHGSRMQGWRLATAFMNPAAQGISRAARAFTFDNPEGTSPFRTVIRSLGLTVASMALWSVNKDDEDMQRVPLSIRTRYWLVRSPWTGMLLRFPKTYLYGDIFGSFMGEAFLDWAFDRDPDILRRLRIALGESLTFSVVPTALLVPWEIGRNKSLHFGTNIESKSMIEGDVPREFRSNRYTTEAARAFSRAVARFAETLDTKGMGRVGNFLQKYNISPVQWDHIIRGYFGTMGYDVMNELPNLLRLGRNGIRKIRNLEPLEFPAQARTRNHFFIRAFTVQFPSANAQPIREFYDQRELFNDFAFRYAALQDLVDEDAPDFERANQEAIAFRENHIQAINAAPLMDGFAQQLGNLAEQRGRAATNEEIDAINETAMRIAIDAVKLVGNLTPAEQGLLDQRRLEREFQGRENARLEPIRNEIDLIIIDRQLRGGVRAPAFEQRQVEAIIRSTPGLTPRDQGTLRRYYFNNREGGMVQQEFNKTPRRIRIETERERRRGR